MKTVAFLGWHHRDAAALRWLRGVHPPNFGSSCVSTLVFPADDVQFHDLTIWIFHQ